jgi:hypothetical protein
VLLLGLCLHACACARATGRVGVCSRVRACSLAYPICNAFAPYFDVICDLSVSAVFFLRYLINGAIFGRTLLNIKRVLIFSTNFI